MEIIATTKSRSLIMLLQKEDKVNSLLTRLRKHHAETYYHCIRVGIMSAAIGGHYSLNENELNLLGYAGLMHDIGKIEIPLAILNKQGELSIEEQDTMHEHPRKGYCLLRNFSPGEVKNIVVAHHEFKLEGYPRSDDRRTASRKGHERRTNNASFLGQIVALADIYDALASKRAYKPALQFQETYAIMKGQFKGEEKHLDELARLYEQHVFKHHSA